MVADGRRSGTHSDLDTPLPVPDAEAALGDVGAVDARLERDGIVHDADERARRPRQEVGPRQDGLLGLGVRLERRQREQVDPVRDAPGAERVSVGVGGRRPGEAQG